MWKERERERERETLGGTAPRAGSWATVSMTPAEIPHPRECGRPMAISAGFSSPSPRFYVCAFLCFVLRAVCLVFPCVCVPLCVLFCCVRACVCVRASPWPRLPSSFFCLLPCAAFLLPHARCSSLKFQLVGPVESNVYELRRACRVGRVCRVGRA